MGNDTAHHRSNKKSPLHSSTESVEDMDTADSTANSYRTKHTLKAGCPSCSGLCAFRSSPSSPKGYASGGARTTLGVPRPTIGYAGTSISNRGDCGSDATPVCSSSNTIIKTGDHSAGSYGGSSGTSIYHRSVTPNLGYAGRYELGGASSTRYTGGGPVRSLMNSSGSFGSSGSFKSSYEAGYEEGLKTGYELALAELSAQRVYAANDNGFVGRDLLALKNGDEDNCVGNQLHHNQNDHNYNNSARGIALFTDTACHTGQSSVRSSANEWRVMGTEADKETKPHNAERDVENFASSTHSHTCRSAETDGNVLGLTEDDRTAILHNAAKAAKYPDASSPTHSDPNDAKRFDSVRPKSRSTSYNGTATRKEGFPRSRSPGSTVMGSTRIVNKNTNKRDSSRESGSNLYPSLEGFEAVTSERQKKFRKKPASQQEKLLAEFTTEVFHHPQSSKVASTRGVSTSTSSGNDTASTPPTCSICITSLTEDSPYVKPQDVSRDLVGCAALKRCGHHFHISCLMQMATHDASWLTCPNCQTIHGVRVGTQPKGGMMNFRKYGGNLPGFPKSSGTIEITYSFRHGNQGPEHPNPGRPYHLVGFPRVAYLPDTAQGNKVLKLLRVAFDRRLIFTVGTSATSGSTDCVVWNGIHHKTETHDSSGHGYPDPKYLNNVMMELASFGVT